MPRATVNGLNLEYDSFGDPASPPLLLVMGLTYQMIHGPQPPGAGLAGRCRCHHRVGEQRPHRRAPGVAKLIYSAITSLDGYVADEDSNFGGRPSQVEAAAP